MKQLQEVLPIKDRLNEAISALSVDYLDIRVENRQETIIHYKGKELQELNETRSYGGVVRALDKGSWGVVSFSDINQLEKACFLRYVKLKFQKQVNQISQKPRLLRILLKQNLKTDPRVSLFREKAELMKRYNELLMDHEHQPSSEVYYGTQLLKNSS
jgi:TldD protein